MAGNKYFQLIGIVKRFWTFDNLNFDIYLVYVFIRFQYSFVQ